RSSQVSARSVRLGTGRLGLEDGSAPSGSVFPQNGRSLIAERLGYGGVRFDLAEQSDQRVDVGGREGSICFRQERMPHWLALEADVGGMALQAAEGAGNTFAGFWHGGAFSRLATDLPIAQGRVDGGVIRASRAVRRSLGCRAQGSGRAGPRKESRRNSVLTITRHGDALLFRRRFSRRSQARRRPRRRDSARSTQFFWCPNKSCTALRFPVRR